LTSAVVVAVSHPTHKEHPWHIHTSAGDHCNKGPSLRHNPANHFLGLGFRNRDRNKEDTYLGRMLPCCVKFWTFCESPPSLDQKWTSASPAHAGIAPQKVRCVTSEAEDIIGSLLAHKEVICRTCHVISTLEELLLPWKLLLHLGIGNDNARITAVRMIVCDQARQFFTLHRYIGLLVCLEQHVPYHLCRQLVCDILHT